MIADSSCGIIPTFTFLLGWLTIPMSPPFFVIILISILVNPIIGYLIGKLFGTIIEKIKE